MRLKGKPIKLLALMLAGTAAWFACGLSLLDGEITTRRLGRLSIDMTPIRFWLAVAAHVLVGALVIAFGWFVVLAEWNADYGPRGKPKFDNPSRRTPA